MTWAPKILLANLNDLPPTPWNPGNKDDANVETRQLRQTEETGQQERVLVTQNFGVGQRDDASFCVGTLRRQNVGDFRDEFVEVGHSVDVVVVVNVVAEATTQIAKDGLKDLARKLISKNWLR